MMQYKILINRVLFCFCIIASKKTTFLAFYDMDIQTIKKTSIVALMNKLGFCIIRTNNSDVWYKSPFRNEKNASFKVDMNKNIWFDFGLGCGGNILDFIMRTKECTFKEALYFLRNEFDSFSFHQSEPIFISRQINKDKSYSINKEQHLQNPILINYLKSRKLQIEICKKYLCEVYYQINDKKYFGVGFKNDIGGLEIRNKYAKLCLGKKWYTIIQNNNKKVIVLEGWSDFLSLLTLYPELEKSHDYIILNSLSMLTKLDVVLESYSEIMFALDNDEAGSKATKFYVEKWQNSLIDIRFIYQNSKDLNEYLVSQRSLKV